MKELSEKLKSLRHEHGYSLQYVGDAVGLSKTHIHELEHGNTKNPSLKSSVKLSKLYGVTLDYLAGLDDKIQLNTCPFCGNAGEMCESEPSTLRFNEGVTNFAVQCFEFTCQGIKANCWSSTPEDAAKQWNKRA